MSQWKGFTMGIRKNRDWRVAGGLLLICLVQLFFLAYFGKQKSFLMCDELFTYTSSNNAEIQAFDMPLNEWLGATRPLVTTL